MPTTTVKLDDSIRAAKERKKELKKSRAQLSQNDRLEVNLLLIELKEEILTLERIRGNQQAASVVIDFPDDASKKEFEKGLKALHKVIQAEQTFDQILQTAQAFLDAIEEINSASERA